MLKDKLKSICKKISLWETEGECPDCRTVSSIVKKKHYGLNGKKSYGKSNS